ncbi:DUF2062 domain-containing protein [Oculatella sp. LEGE 06141]|uniref:DUF2062 domain-containing protein n=1 Tax=Oculatella sp. LEGE 06141 TaxID=1828648 RepID=UPI00187ED67A|nr:DUF2062 domain-containing protein [Oculatella sp. LEGE 06141]MBE9177033.1 DUF2062 domain-containing protein [Oculatella sp. LEGE 06141]
MNKGQRWLRYFYLRFIRLRATPSEISLGFALGIFWGMFPLPGLQMAIAVLSAALIRGNKFAAAAGTWFSNPLTTLPLTAFNFHVGQVVLGSQISDFPIKDVRSLSNVMQLGKKFLVSYLLGCLIVGCGSGVLSYFLSLPIILAIQKRTLARRIKKKHR